VDDVVSTALKIGEFILSNSNVEIGEVGKEQGGKLKEETEGKKSGVPALVRRAKDFPMLASELGLSSALIFYISKAENQDVLFNSYKVFYSLLISKSGELEGDVKGVINSALKTDEGAGYDVYAGLTFALIGTKLDQGFGLKPPEKGSSSEAFLVEALKILKNTEESGKGFELQRRLMPYLIEIKRVMEVVGVAYK
jgi:hypothetical protein